MNFSDHFVDLNLYKIKKTGNLLRILHINDNYEDLIAIEFNENGHASKMPRQYDAMSIWQQIENGALVLQEEEEDKFLKGDSPLSEAEEARIKKISDIFLPLLNHERIFIARSRNKLVKKLIEKYPNYRKSVYRKLKEYWVGGCNPNAWISQFANCGGAGKTRKAGNNKRGRKREGEHTPIGINVGEKERAWIKAGVNKNKGLSIDETYNAIAEEHYGKKVNGKIVVDWALAFTIGQFKYWRKKLISASNLLKNEIGQKEFDLSERPKRGSANKNVFGIGSCYQIDATLDNVHLVSSIGRTVSIGRPTLYIVRDVYSRMIVGFYITTHPPSGMVARLALENAAINKVEYCKKFGINIKESQWPAMHLPKELFADNAELVSEKFSTIVKRFGITVRNSRSGRGDDKSIVERGFFLLQNRLKGTLKNRGGLGRKFGKRGGKDTRKDSSITLRDYTEIVIRAILEYNNDHPIKDYPFSKSMQEQGMSDAIPVKLWEFAKSKGLVNFNKFNRKNLWRSLLPTKECSVSDTGIKFYGDWWAPLDKTMDNYVHEHYLQKQGNLKIAYDPRFMESVYLIHKANFYKLQRTGDPVDYESLFELQEWNKLVSKSREKAIQKERTSKLNTNAEFKRILREGKAASPKLPKRTDKTRQTRNQEQQRENNTERQERESRESTNKKFSAPTYTHKTGRSSSRREINNLKNLIKKKSK